MAVRSMLVVGAAPDCDIVLQGPGIAARHVQLAWRDGLVVHDLGAGQTFVDGRLLQAHEAVSVPTFQTPVLLGTTPLPLHHPLVASLFVERSPVVLDGGIIVGRDPLRAHVLVQHPTVSGAHARIDRAARSFSDVGSRSGTFDRLGQRIAQQQPATLDVEAGYFYGLAWVSTSVILAVSELPPIDVVLVSHNHHDHLDPWTIRRLGPAPLYVTPLGNGSVLRRSGAGEVVELDWWESTRRGDLEITLVPARHWSMRTPF
ncbi:MAG: FHA domain-containing protein, partial [Deltaproteobacteria bacterium]